MTPKYFNNSVTFSGKSMIGSEEFFNQMVESLGKIKSEKNRMCSYRLGGEQNE